MTLKTRLITHLISAQDDDNEVHDLRILTDESSHKLANKIFKTYISQDDFGKFHQFLIDFDRLLAKFGGRAPKIMLRPSSKNNQPQQGPAQGQQNMDNTDDL